MGLGWSLIIKSLLRRNLDLDHSNFILVHRNFQVILAVSNIDFQINFVTSNIDFLMIQLAHIHMFFSVSNIEFHKILVVFDIFKLQMR